jgi:hypothetical protein
MSLGTFPTWTVLSSGSSTVPRGKHRTSAHPRGIGADRTEAYGYRVAVPRDMNAEKGQAKALQWSLSSLRAVGSGRLVGVEAHGLQSSMMSLMISADDRPFANLHYQKSGVLPQYYLVIG